jgi:hypothetical protein
LPASVEPVFFGFGSLACATVCAAPSRGEVSLVGVSLGVVSLDVSVDAPVAPAGDGSLGVSVDAPAAPAGAVSLGVSVDAPAVPAAPACSVGASSGVAVALSVFSSAVVAGGCAFVERPWLACFAYGFVPPPLISTTSNTTATTTAPPAIARLRLFFANPSSESRSGLVAIGACAPAMSTSADESLPPSARHTSSSNGFGPTSSGTVATVGASSGGGGWSFSSESRVGRIRVAITPA